jgi:hypothetical protein
MNLSMHNALSITPPSVGRWESCEST